MLPPSNPPPGGPVVRGRLARASESISSPDSTVRGRGARSGAQGTARARLVVRNRIRCSDAVDCCGRLPRLLVSPDRASQMPQPIGPHEGALLEPPSPRTWVAAVRDMIRLTALPLHLGQATSDSSDLRRMSSSKVLAQGRQEYS